jgi:flagellin
MRESAVQAANGTNTDTDRQMIQEEIDAMSEAIDDIAKHTEFNTDLYPLNNPQSNYISEVAFSINVPNGHTFTIDGVAYQQGETANINCLRVDRTSVASGGQFAYYAFYYSDENSVCGKVSPNGDFTPISLVYNTVGTNTYHSLSKSDVKTDSDGYLYVDLTPYGNTDKFYLLLDPDLPSDVGEFENSGYITSKDVLIPASKQLWIQAGTSANQGINVQMVDATVSGLSLTSLDVTTNINANKAITSIDKAVNLVSNYRSYFGAQQNRLEHAINVTDNMAENTQASESKIRDADMSKEMIEFAKNQILEQAATSLLLQASQSKEGILRLLE